MTSLVAPTASIQDTGNPVSASVWLGATRPHHIQRGTEVQLSDWQGERDQGSLLNYRLELCIQLCPRL